MTLLVCFLGRFHWTTLQIHPTSRWLIDLTSTGCLGWNKFPRSVWEKCREDQKEDALLITFQIVFGLFVQTQISVSNYYQKCPVVSCFPTKICGYILRSPPPPIWDTRLHDSSILRHDDREPDTELWEAGAIAIAFWMIIDIVFK